MKSFLSILLLFVTIAWKSFAFSTTPPPDEGMWLPLLLKDYNYDEMKRLGLKLTAEQIYSVNNASLKDAIVQLGSFCTAEIISDEGLILTNHHCAYDAIASSSSEENNYLEDGFWSKSKEEEIPVAGLTVSFLVRMEDVTKKIMDKVEAGEEGERDMIIQEAMAEIEENAQEGYRYTINVKEMFDGNAFYLFVYDVYRDIRLVGAPPSAVGKFGGDTDNWMWPRHTADFSLLRIYAAPDNRPDDYSEKNVPMKPRHFLPVSTKGVSEGDFTMILGYPANTNRYMTSYEVAELQNYESPAIINLVGKRLAIMKTEMDKSEAVKIQHASSYASLSNTYKYYKGQSRGLEKFKLLEQKQAYEKSLTEWIKEDPDRLDKYGSVLMDIAGAFELDKTLTTDKSILNMAGFGPELVGYGIGLWRWKNSSDRDANAEVLDKILEPFRKGVEDHFSNYAAELDKKLFVMALNELQTMSEQRQLDLFTSTLYLKKAKGSNERFAELVFKKSILTNQELLDKFLAKPTGKTLEKDPGVIFVNSLINAFRSSMSASSMMQEAQLASARLLYMQAIQEKEDGKTFYPDANFTMRLTYGTVQNYDAWDGKPYKTFTYGDEIVAKHKEGDPEFDVPDGLIQLLKDKDFGAYANEDGELPICFLHNTDITGGNSGSPVINGDGELIGIAFDGNWESMTSDLYWQDDYVRTISVDIRYVLFIIDKFAGATHLVEEMNLVSE